VRRALGARRWDIFVQHVIECEVMALAGGLLGLALASAGLSLVSFWYEAMTPSNRDDIFRMDLSMAWFAAAASLTAGLLAGVYPAHRVCRMAPASHLKIQ
jgi:putative ABC transport system permease protein